jgi:Icc-related predicted phosphoesterase
VRILAVTDVHYRLGHFDWLLANSASADVIAISGDLADVASPVPLEVQIFVIERYLEQLAESAVVLVVSGNHDLDGPGVHGEQVASWLRRPRIGPVHSDGASVDIDGYRFTMCPWWDGPITRQEVDAQLEQAAVDRPRRWIWLYHAPPAGTVLCFDGRRKFPDQDLADWIARYQPDIVFTGHIHQAPWTEGGSWHDKLGDTYVFNAGHQVGKVPAHIRIDTSTGTVDWFGIFDNESITLDQRLIQPSGSRAEPGRAVGW